MTNRPLVDSKAEHSVCSHRPGGASRRQFAIIVGLGILAIVAYHRVVACDFVVWDDELVVTLNDNVTTGLNWDNAVWAFAIHGPMQWHPLGWLSHQTDCSVSGLNSHLHHLVNLCLHIAAVGLLYIALQSLTEYEVI